MSANADSTSAHLYEIVKNDLLVKILDGTYGRGSMIPCERELMEAYKCSRITVRRAVSDLVDGGHLVKRRGTGTFVASAKHARHVININSFTKDCKEHGIVPRTEVTMFGFQRPNDRDRRDIDAEKNALLLHLHRVRYANEEPVIIEHIVFPEKYSKLCEVSPAEFSSVSSVIESRLMTRIAYSEFDIELAYATRDEADVLRVHPGTSVILVKMRILDENKELLYITRQIITGERYTISGFQPLRA